MREPIETTLQHCVRVAAALGEFYEPQDVAQWFTESQPLLQDRRPVDLIQTEGGWLELLAAVQRLRDGAYL